MRISKEKLFSEAEVTGFRPEILEKVIRLLSLLEGFRSHPFLKGRLALKGGTALNFFFISPASSFCGHRPELYWYCRTRGHAC